MRILIITQNEPFYLTKSLRYLLNILPDHSELVGCVVAYYPIKLLKIGHSELFCLNDSI